MDYIINLRLFFLFFIFILFSGCGLFSDTYRTMDEVKSARGSGQKNIYSSSHKTTMQAIPLALREAGFEIHSINSEESYVLAKYFQPGERKSGHIVAVFARKESGMTEVEITTKSMIKDDFGGGDSTELIFYQIDKKLTEIDPNKKMTIKKPSKDYFIEIAWFSRFSLDLNKKLSESLSVGILHTYRAGYFKNSFGSVDIYSFGIQLNYILNGKDIAADSGWYINPFFYFNRNNIEVNQTFQNSRKYTIYNKEFGLLAGYQMFRKRHPFGTKIAVGVSRPFDPHLFSTVVTPDYLSEKYKINLTFKFCFVYSF